MTIPELDQLETDVLDQFYSSGNLAQDMDVRGRISKLFEKKREALRQDERMAHD